MSNWVFPQMLQFIVSKIPSKWLSWLSSLQYRFPFLRGIIQWGADRFRRCDGVIQRGVGKGLKFNTTANVGYLFGTSEPDVQHALSVMIKKGMVFYDVGANIGFMSLIAARLVGNGGKVLCFEPLKENQRQIEHNASINDFTRISVYGVALSDRETSVRFAVSAISTVGRITDSVSTENCQLPDQFKEFIDVPARRLDWIIDNEKLPLPDVVKMDVEGAEAAVLRGATATMKSAKPLFLIELHGTNKNVYEILTEAGYRVCVLGSQEEVCNAHWNSHVIAVPDSHRDADALVRALCIEDKGTK